MECQHVGQDLRMCGAPAVYDITGDRCFPRCLKHKSSSVYNARRFRSERIYWRARERGLVTQAEELARAEADVEKRLCSWEWWAGREVGGRFDYYLMAVK